ncbi:unnamed protein product, partial [Heterosigma akashiwo]
RFLAALLISLYLGKSGYKKKSLDFSGAVAAVTVGLISFTVSIRFGAILILFYKSSSVLTKYKGKIKQKMDDHSLEGGQRNYVQVYSCSALASAVALAYFLLQAGPACQPGRGGLGLGAGRCSRLVGPRLLTGTWWASELGVLSRSRPRLITTFCLKTVPPGTNGGLSLVGTAASVAGGAVIGLVFVCGGTSSETSLGGDELESSSTSEDEATSSSSEESLSEGNRVILGAVSGFVGSMIDSLLGATLQATYFDLEKKCITSRHKKANTSRIDRGDVVHVCGIDLLTNEQVNMISV